MPRLVMFDIINCKFIFPINNSLEVFASKHLFPNFKLELLNRVQYQNSYISYTGEVTINDIFYLIRALPKTCITITESDDINILPSVEFNFIVN